MPDKIPDDLLCVAVHVFCAFTAAGVTYVREIPTRVVEIYEYDYKPTFYPAKQKRVKDWIPPGSNPRRRQR